MHTANRQTLFLFLLSTSTLFGQRPVHELEPPLGHTNDTPGTAERIFLGDEIDGDLGFSLPDVDWFWFITTGGNVPLYLSGDGRTAVDARLALFDSTGTTMLAFNDDVRSVLPALNLNLEAGTYRIRIDGFSATSSGRYFLDTAQNPFDPYTGQELEPNDDRALAMPIPLDSEIKCKIGPKDDDVDYYRIFLPTPAVPNPGPARYGLWIQVTDGDAPCISRTRLDFYDAAGALLDPSRYGPNPGNSSDFNFRMSQLRCWEPGTYYIKVTKSTSTSPGEVVRTGYYRLEVKVMPMNNNGIVQESTAPRPSLPPLPITPGVRVDATLYAVEPLDLYSMVVTRPTVVMYQSADRGSLQQLAHSTLEVLDSNQELVDFSRHGNILETPGTSHARGTVLLKLPGTYYFRLTRGIGAPASGNSDYTLEIGQADLPYVGAEYKIFDDVLNTACLGSNGLRPTITQLGEREVPSFGTVLSRTVVNMRPGSLFWLFASNETTPTDLSVFGLPGCFGYLSISSLAFSTEDPVTHEGYMARGDGTFRLNNPIPTTLVLRGLPIYEQILVFDSTPPPTFVVSNYALQIIGDRSY